MQGQFGIHNLLLYTNRDTLRNICSNYCKAALDSSSEIVLILTYYDSVKDWMSYLKDTGIHVDKHKNDGSLIVIESKKEYKAHSRRKQIQFANDVIYVNLIED